MSNNGKSVMTTTRNPSKANSKRPIGRLGRKKFAGHAGRSDEAEEPSKTQQKYSTIPARKKKSHQPTAEEEPSVNIRKNRKEDRKEEDPSVLATKNKDKKDNTDKVIKAAALPASVVAGVDEYVESSTKIDNLRDGFAKLQELLPDVKEHEKCCENKERCRFSDIPCLDATRIVLDPKEDDPNSCNFIHANKVSIEGADREYIITQLPLENTYEDFWRMVFQAQSTNIVVLCIFFEAGKSNGDLFWPQENNTYKYYGKMFINNKKTEFNANCTIYTIEVLPDGCSNSLITRIYHFTTWEPNHPPTHSRMLLRLIRSVKQGDTGTITVVSSEGVGRAPTYVLVDAVTTRLFKGQNTSLMEVATQLRKQRAMALKQELLYLTAAQVILDYIRVKVPKHNAAFDALKKAITTV